MAHLTLHWEAAAPGVRSLVFFDDADREPPLRLLTEAPWARVKEDFRTWVGALLNGASPQGVKGEESRSHGLHG